MFGYGKRIKELEFNVIDQNRQNESLREQLRSIKAEIECQKGKHNYELKHVGVGLGVERRGDVGSKWTHYDEYRPAKVCEHYEDTVNLKEADND